MKLITHEVFRKKIKGKEIGCELPEVLGFRCGNFVDCRDCSAEVSSLICESWENEIQNIKNGACEEAKKAKITLEEFKKAVASEDANFGRCCTVASEVGIECREMDSCNECRRKMLNEIAIAWAEDAR